MSTQPVEDTSPAWNKYRVPVFRGLFDSKIETGEDYETKPLASFFSMAPWNKAKASGPAFVPSLHHDFDAREHAAQREKGNFVALTGDIDTGNHDSEAVVAAVAAFAIDNAWLVYSSPHARPGDMRWRIILPLAEPQPFDTWYDAQEAFFAFMEARGFAMDHALSRAAQPVFLPNVPLEHAKTGTALRDEDGRALYYVAETVGVDAPGLELAEGPAADGIATIRTRRAEDERLREKVRQEAESRRANKPRGDGASLMEDFNASNSVASMLELCGYEQSPRDPEDYRSPHQTGDTYATRVIGSKWVSLSASDTSAGVGEKCKSGCFGDAYDLYVHYKHGSDHKAAYRALGQERRDANVVYLPQAEPPEWMNELPPYDDAPDWVEDGEPVIDEPASSEDPSKPRLPFFWFHDAQPNLDANDFVEGLLTSSAMSVVYGPSNCGKTFFVVDVALHVALGRAWRGREVDQGAVVYLSLEGAQGIRNRLAAFRAHHKLDGEQLPFVAMPQPVNLLNEDADVNAVIELVKHVATETGLHVAMVIVDTLSRAMAGGNENSPEDMTAIVGNCDRIRDATGAHVCIVHHSGKDEARGARGHSSLRAATDTEIEITREQDGDVSNVRVAKQRDLEAGDPFAFSLQSVPLGTNRRGKDVTSCVVLGAEKPSPNELGRDAIVKAFAVMVDAWTEGKPLSNKPQSRDTGRYAPAIFSREFGGRADVWKDHISEWIYQGCISFEVRDAKAKLSGLRVLKPIF